MSNDERREALRWQAVEARDVNAVGQFAYDVRSRGIYCTPTCSARPEGRKSVEFFGSPCQAREHGFRACKNHVAS